MRIAYQTNRNMLSEKRRQLISNNLVGDDHLAHKGHYNATYFFLHVVEDCFFLLQGMKAAAATVTLNSILLMLVLCVPQRDTGEDLVGGYHCQSIFAFISRFLIHVEKSVKNGAQ